MKALKIIITITDPETLSDYFDEHEDIIINDFWGQPEVWGKMADKVEVKKII